MLNRTILELMLMTKKHRKKTGRNGNHRNATKEVDRVVQQIHAMPGVSTAIPGATRQATGGKNTIEVRFQRLANQEGTKLKFVMRARNYAQDLIVIVESVDNADTVTQGIEDMFKAE